MDTLTVALWATSLAPPLNGIDAWAARLDAQMAEAREAGARLLVMPEYACEQWLSFAPADLPPAQEIAWMAAQAPAALAAARALARTHDMALVAGTMPAAIGNGAAEHRNRAWLALPDGRLFAQDKLVLTPSEKDPAAWLLTPGDRVAVIEWTGLRLAVLICLDIEMPALAARLAPLDLDLVLVPSMTAGRAGYHRVFDCAKARAIELQAIVCAVGAIGAPERLLGRETNCSGAAAFVPCEPALGDTGLAASIGPWHDVAGPGPMLIARDLPIDRARAARRGGAEVWPGAWSAEHIVIEDPAGGSP